MKRSKKKIIGIFGGTFDPPHKGHVKIASKSIKILKLDKLYWLITNQNPFKPKPYYSNLVRIKKSKQIIKKKDNILIKNLDKIVRSSQTYKTVKYLSLKHKNAIFFLILGSDNLINFHKWKNWKELTKITKLVVFSRTGYDAKAKKSVIVNFLKQKNIIFVKNYKINISSSKLRENLLS